MIERSIRGKFKALVYGLIDWISFDEKIVSIVDKLNQTFEEPIVKPVSRLHSHPGGYRREFGKRRLNIAEAYMIIAKSQSPDLYEARLNSLQTIIEQSLYAKTVAMPINTARMQIYLMKKAVESYGNRRKQMEYISDFGSVSFGNETVIRNFLRKHGLIEVPEEEKPLKQLSLGWDDHVRDSLSDGRKSPSQLMADAFIKGLSRITIVYNNLDEPRIISEALNAGEIMGVAVEIGIEFSVGKGKHKRRYLYIPPVFSKSKDFFNFLKENEAQLSEFREGMRANVLGRRKTIISMINQFNDLHLPRLNEGFSYESPCWFHMLREDELDKIVGYGQPSIEHLSELLYEKFKVVYHKRVLYLKALVISGEKKLRKHNYSKWEFDFVKNWYEETRHIYNNLNQDDLTAKYLVVGSAIEYDSVFSDEKPVFEMLRGLPGKIVFLNPLEMGLKNAIKHIVEHVDYLTNVELMNLKGCSSCNPNDILLLNKFLYNLNNLPESEMHEFLNQHEIDINHTKVAFACRSAFERNIAPSCGSGATGRNSLIPGMGFIRSSRISQSVKKAVLSKHISLPQPIGTMILNRGKWPHDLYAKEDEDFETLVSLGATSSQSPIKVGDEEKNDLIELSKTWQYLNPNLKNLILFVSGFSITMYWMYYIQFNNFFNVALFFAILWMCITFFRNILVDLIASAGTDFKQWTAKNVNFSNAYQSLFWTGLSVPVLGLVKQNFDLLWIGEKGGFIFEGVKFLALSLANGIYIVSHNKLRSFDKNVIKINFFRSILSWPFATVFAPFFNGVGIPSIVQAKFWSDVVGGIIEGGAKFSQRFRLRKRDMNSIIPKLSSKERSDLNMAMLDILYIWARAPRGKTCLRLLLLNRPSLGERIWRSKNSAEENKLKTIRCKKDYDKLLSLFGAEGMVSNLTEFALKNYPVADAIKLTDLIASEAESLNEWLESLEKYFDKDLTIESLQNRTS